MFNIVDSKYDEELTLDQIIQNEIGDLSQSYDLSSLVDQAIEYNKSSVEKILKKKNKKSKKGGPAMFLVGEVMKLTNRQGDPQEIERIINERLGL